MPLWLRRQFTFNDGSFIYFNRECNDSNLKNLGNKINESVIDRWIPLQMKGIVSLRSKAEVPLLVFRLFRLACELLRLLIF